MFSSVLSSGNPKIYICLFSLCRIEEEAKQTQSGIVTMFERLKVRDIARLFLRSERNIFIFACLRNMFSFS